MCEVWSGVKAVRISALQKCSNKKPPSDLQTGVSVLTLHLGG